MGGEDVLGIFGGKSGQRLHASFFQQTFGRDADEFKAIASMPNEFIRNRLVGNWRELNSFEARWTPYVREWMTEFARLSSIDKEALTDAIASDDIELIGENHSRSSGRVKKLLELHLEGDGIVASAKRQQGAG